MPGIVFSLLYLPRRFWLWRCLALFGSAALQAAALSGSAQAVTIYSAEENRFPPAPRAKIRSALPPAYSAARTARPLRQRRLSRPPAAHFYAPYQENSYAVPRNGGGLPYRVFRYPNSSGSFTEPLNNGRYAGAEPLFHPDAAAYSLPRRAEAWQTRRSQRKYAAYRKPRRAQRRIVHKMKTQAPPAKAEEPAPRRSLREEALKYRYHDVP